MTVSSVNDNETFSFKMSDWLHCNTCFNQPGDGSSFFLTNCSHVHCSRCEKTGWKQKCTLCGAPNPEIWPLTTKTLTPHIKTFFTEPPKLMQKIISEMQQLTEATAFQHRQRKRYIDFLQNKIRNQKDSVEKIEQELKNKFQCQFDTVQRENFKLREENAYLKRLLSEKSHGNSQIRSPVGKTNSSPVFVSSSSPKQHSQQNRSNNWSSLSSKVSPGYGLTTITANRISVRTPPSGGKMGVIPPCTPFQKPNIQGLLKSVPHPIQFGSAMEVTPRY